MYYVSFNQYDKVPSCSHVSFVLVIVLVCRGRLLNTVCKIMFFYSKTNQRHNISNWFYFGTTLYRFRTFSPSIIRSL